MSVIQFIAQYWDSLILVAAFIIFCVMLVKRGETAKLNRILLAFVTKAEKQFGSGTGALKLSTVIHWLYEQIPAIIKLLYTEQELVKIVEDALEEAKEQWEKNSRLTEFIEEKAE